MSNSALLGQCFIHNYLSALLALLLGLTSSLLLQVYLANQLFLPCLTVFSLSRPSVLSFGIIGSALALVLVVPVLMFRGETPLLVFVLIVGLLLAQVASTIWIIVCRFSIPFTAAAAAGESPGRVLITVFYCVALAVSLLGSDAGKHNLSLFFAITLPQLFADHRTSPALCLTAAIGVSLAELVLLLVSSPFELLFTLSVVVRVLLAAAFFIFK
jgi:hypothetical protein